MYGGLQNLSEFKRVLDSFGELKSISESFTEGV